MTICLTSVRCYKRGFKLRWRKSRAINGGISADVPRQETNIVIDVEAVEIRWPHLAPSAEAPMGVGCIPTYTSSCWWGCLCAVCFASKKPSEGEFFVPAGTDLAVNLLTLNTPPRCKEEEYAQLLGNNN
jgi:hypothetical protein